MMVLFTALFVALGTLCPVVSHAIYHRLFQPWDRLGFFKAIALGLSELLILLAFISPIFLVPFHEKGPRAILVLGFVAGCSAGNLLVHKIFKKK